MEEINFQEQHDKSFLISETSGNVAAHFNKIAKLDKIDKGLQKVQKEINSAKFSNYLICQVLKIAIILHVHGNYQNIVFI